MKYKELDESLLPEVLTPMEAFSIFWEAGMRKLNKKAAHKIFMRIIKTEPNLMDFALKLDNDIKWRLSNEQYGFNAMHPTTYLNGERWEDEQIPKGGKLAYEQLNEIGLPEQVADMTLEDHMDRSWAE